MFSHVTEPILVWPKGRGVPRTQLPPGYEVRAALAADDDAWVRIHRLAIPGLSEATLRAGLAGYRPDALEGGILIAWENSSGLPVATAGSLADSKGEMFPSGGQLGWVATVPGHRGRGLSTYLCSLATQRLLDDGFSSVFLSTGDEMRAAIRTYMRIGYIPCLYDALQPPRWQAICRVASLPFEPERWPSREDYISCTR
jgi:mycothiol synthase